MQENAWLLTLGMLRANDKYEGIALYFDTNSDTLQDSVIDGQTYRQNILVRSCAF
jgi:hypothetical protein